MNLEEARILLGDYLDGELSPQQRIALERHLAASPELRRELEALRGLQERARALPDDLAPGRDLWPEISARSASGAGGGWLRRLAGYVLGSPGARRPAFATVAVTAVALLAVVAVWQLGNSDSPDRDRMAGGEANPTVLAVLSDLDVECAPSALETAGYGGDEDEAHRSPILELIAHNLRIIDLAIADAREAWQADPESPQLMRLLTSAYRAKAALQRQETRLAAQL
jgi:hypothetical protein